MDEETAKACNNGGEPNYIVLNNRCTVQNSYDAAISDAKRLKGSVWIYKIEVDALTAINALGAVLNGDGSRVHGLSREFFKFK